KTRNAVEGVATFNDLSINEVGAGYTLVASAAGLASATSTPFNVTKSILIYGPTLATMDNHFEPPQVISSNEKIIAEANGYTVTVKSATEWTSMSTAQFKAYNAIVFADPD